MNNMNIHGNNDPIANLINKLSSGEELRVNLQSETDKMIIKTYNDNPQPLQINIEQRDKIFPNQKKLFNLLSNRRSPSFPTYDQKYLIEKLKNVPIYTVVNGSNEMIMASPRSHHTSNSINWIREKYNELFLWSYDEGPVTLSLFFLNKEDAETYLHEICKKEPKESEALGLKVITVGLDLFYKLNRTSPPKIQTKLVADLKEIEVVLSNYANKALYTMHPKQKYSKSWFQGTPIYILKLTKTQGKNTLVSYNFKDKSEKKIIFFSKEDALRAWKVYASKPNKAILKKEPNLEIYNFESLVNDLETEGVQGLLDMYVIPPYESYTNSKIKSNFQDSVTYSPLEKYIFKGQLQLQQLKRFYKGLLWLLTSDTLPTEDNSW